MVIQEAGSISAQAVYPIADFITYFMAYLTTNFFGCAVAAPAAKVGKDFGRHPIGELYLISNKTEGH